MCYRPKTVALFVYERNYSHFLPDFNNRRVYFHGDGNIRDQQSEYRTDRWVKSRHEGEKEEDELLDSPGFEIILSLFGAQKGCQLLPATKRECVFIF